MRIHNGGLEVSGVPAPISMASGFVTDPLYLGHIVNFSIQCVFTGTPGGNFTLECSNDEGQGDKVLNKYSSEGVVNWTTVADSAFVVAAAGNVTWDVQNVGYRWVRVRWTQTSSTGSVTSARYNVKGA